MKRNLLLIAAAGAGKTTYVVKDALKSNDKVLITTFTTENEAEIKKKIIKEKGFIPENIVVQTWFSFLLEHGVRPYQGCVDERMFDYDVKGLLLVTSKSGVYKAYGKTIPYSEDKNFFHHYFTREQKIYSDKIAKFVYRACEKSNNAVIQRLEKMYSSIYIDEVQDLAGYDLDLVKILMSSTLNIILVGDPRQVTYYTHWEQQNAKYRNGKIELFLKEKCPKKLNIIIDKETLNKSHRNNQPICDFSSLLYKNEYSKSEPCSCEKCHPTEIEHQGIFLVSEKDKLAYLEKYSAVQLIWNRTNKSFLNDRLFYTMGGSKGKTFNRVLIYPTKDMLIWLSNTSFMLKDEARAKLYVAISRARHSVAFVVNEKEIQKIKNIPIWIG